MPCPLCGGLIHPIAGRCKHCKGDLRTTRSTRPAAAATLPSLTPVPGAHANGRPTTNGASAPATGAPAAAPAQSLVQAVAAAAPIPLAIHHGPVDAVAILPPRPTGRHPAAAPRSSWKSWPVLVIILAVVAIVTAVVLMVFPPGGPKTDEGSRNSLTPAPDRMDTNPTPAPSTPRQPPSTSPDPWSRRGGGSGPGAQVDPPADDPDIDSPDVDDAITRDPLARRGGGGLGGLGGGSLGGGGTLGTRGTDMLYTIVKQACSKAQACSISNAQVRALCDQYARYPHVTPPRCPAAARCLRSIDDLSCDASLDDPLSLLQLPQKLSDCADAMSC